MAGWVVVRWVASWGMLQPSSRTCRQARTSAKPRRLACWSRWRWRPSSTVKPPLRTRRRGKRSAGGVSHALGVPGAPPLRKTRTPQVTCADERDAGGGASTRIGNSATSGHGDHGDRSIAAAVDRMTSGLLTLPQERGPAAFNAINRERSACAGGRGRPRARPAAPLLRQGRQPGPAPRQAAAAGLEAGPMTSRQAQRRALERALDADTVNDAYDARGA